MGGDEAAALAEVEVEAGLERLPLVYEDQRTGQVKPIPPLDFATGRLVRLVAGGKFELVRRGPLGRAVPVRFNVQVRADHATQFLEARRRAPPRAPTTDEILGYVQTVQEQNGGRLPAIRNKVAPEVRRLATADRLAAPKYETVEEVVRANRGTRRRRRPAARKAEPI